MDAANTSKPRLQSSRRRLIVWTLVSLAVGVLAWDLMMSRSLAALTHEQQHELAQQTSQWIRAERDAQRPLASPLAPSEFDIFESYFPEEILREARVHAVAKMPSPEFLGKLRHRGKRVIDLRLARGLALDDTILLRGAKIPAGSPARRSVLFHELVHCVQYRAFGIESFVDHYLDSMVASGYSYPDIIFEQQAFELQHRFDMQQDTPFSVALEVDRLLAQAGVSGSSESIGRMK